MNFADTHMGKVKQMPCRTCDNQTSLTEVHHVRDMGKRIGDMIVIPLCVECHRGQDGVHGTQAVLRLAKQTELQLANEILEGLYA